MSTYCSVAGKMFKYCHIVTVYFFEFCKLFLNNTFDLDEKRKKADIQNADCKSKKLKKIKLFEEFF